MGEKTRAKFRCVSEKRFATDSEYEFQAVIADSEENKEFFTATPAGTIKLSLVRSGAFIPGQEYFIDFTEAGF